MKITTQARSSEGEIRGINLAREVGIRNKWGAIKQLRAGAISRGSGTKGDRQVSKNNPAVKLKMKGKVYKPGEIPINQPLISSYLKFTRDRATKDSPEEE